MPRLSFLPLLLAAGCDYTGDFLFSEIIEGLDDVWILTDPDGELLTPADVTDVDQLRAATIYGEVGAPQTTDGGGVTVDFIGTGGPVCIWVDPETVSWNQAVAEQSGGEIWAKYTYPDNPFDDGDLDLLGGLSVYYTGSPGETIGDFNVDYEDSLGNDVLIELISCPSTRDPRFDGLSTSGKGFPEFCDIPATDIGVSYTILLETWSVPIDDDRLSFGVIVANGDCVALQNAGTSGSLYSAECLIQGESLVPAPDEFGPYYGFDAIDGRIWPDSITFENHFCRDPLADDQYQMRIFCNEEADAIQESGEPCGWEEFDPSTGGLSRCYCGDPNDTPDGGAF